MASKARFGRLPRAAPSLTSTIVALAQEYQRVRESNIIDAWKNGGEFEGKKVHDKDILAWMKSRRNELSQGDPKWDYYDNQIAQYEFAIENSKMELKYKRKDATDAQMVAFYHKWSAKLPTDSEAYREREKLAAAYADRAATSAAGGRRAAADRAYGAALQKDWNKEAPYDGTLTFIEEEAHNRGILQKGETLDDIDPNTADGHAINTLWDEIAHSPEFATKRKWYADQIKKNGNPNFNGDFSHDAFNGYGRTKKAAVTDRIQTAKNAGRKQDTTNFRKERDQVRGATILTGGFDEMSEYEDARAEWEGVFGDPNATLLEKDRANQKYTADLTKIRDGLSAALKPGEHDDRLGAVNNELKTMTGDEHPVQHWGGMFGPGGNEGGKDATETAQGINLLKKNLDDLGKRDSNGDPLFFMVKTADGYNPTDTNDHNHRAAPWGVVSRDQLDDNATFVIQNDPDPRGGKIVTAVQPTAIHIVGDIRDGATGEVTKKQSDTPSAYHYTMPDGTVGYKYQDASGKWLYTPDNPFGPNVPTIDKDGGRVYVPGGNGVAPPTNATAMLPSYYNPGANIAMTSRIAKSGYGMWLIASDPKHGAAYATKPEDIVATMRLEAGNDPARLQEMIVDADQRRAVYLGTSTDEQNRVRNNYYNGTPNPVPLTEYAGIKAPSAEAKVIAELTGARGSQADVENRRGQIAAGLQSPYAAVSEGLTLDEETRGRRNTMIPGFSPDRAGPIPPTSIGSVIPQNMSLSLATLLQGLTAGASAAGLPKMPTGGALTNPGGPAYNGAPPATPPAAKAPGATAPAAITPPPPASHPPVQAVKPRAGIKPWEDPNVLRNQHGPTEFG